MKFFASIYSQFYLYIGNRDVLNFIFVQVDYIWWLNTADFFVNIKKLFWIAALVYLVLKFEYKQWHEWGKLKSHYIFFLFYDINVKNDISQFV